MRRAAILLLALLAACAPPAREDPRPAPDSLVGEYRVAAVDGIGLDKPYGVTLSITGGRVAFVPGCAAFVWSYAYRNGVLDIERRLEKLHHPPPRVCEEPIAPELMDLARALDAVDRAGRTPANGLELSGRGRSVLLFAQ